MYEEVKREIIKSALKLVKYGLIRLSGGNLSVKIGKKYVIVTPSGMDYEEISIKDMVVIDINGNIIEGFRKPSVDIKALIYIYRNMEHVNAVIHAHTVYATCVGLLGDKLPSVVTTLANAVGGEVKVAPFSSATSIEMGMRTVANIGDKKAIILKNHGVITIGETLKEAMYALVYLEEAAKIFCVSRSIGQPTLLTEKQTKEAVEVFKKYGQE